MSNNTQTKYAEAEPHGSYDSKLVEHCPPPLPSFDPQLAMNLPAKFDMSREIIEIPERRGPKYN